MTIPKKDFVSVYWVCDDCAKSRGWVCTKNAITVISGKCGHCKDNKTKTLTPVVDFQRGKTPPVFD